MAKYSTSYYEEELPGLQPWGPEEPLRPGDPLEGVIPDVVRSFDGGSGASTFVGEAPNGDPSENPLPAGQYYLSAVYDNGMADVGYGRGAGSGDVMNVPVSELARYGLTAPGSENMSFTQEEGYADGYAPAGWTPESAQDPLAGLIGRAGELSAEPEEPSYTPAAELGEDTGPRPASDLGDESVDELEYAQAEVAGIAESLRQLERDMGGTGEEESKRVNPDLVYTDDSSNRVTEESAWDSYQGERRPYSAISEGLRGIASAINPRQYGADWLADRNHTARQRARGEFDYQRQLRNEDRNELQEDFDRNLAVEDRTRRISTEDEAAARRRVLQGREDTLYGQGQQEREEARSVSSDPNVRYRQSVSELLEEVGFSEQEAAEYTQDLRVGDTQRQAAINGIVEMRNQRRRDEAAALARRDLELLRNTRRARGGGTGNATPENPSGIHPVTEAEIDAWVDRVEQSERRRLSREPREDGSSEYTDMRNFARRQLQVVEPGKARERIHSSQMNTVTNTGNRVNVTAEANQGQQQRDEVVRGWVLSPGQTALLPAQRNQAGQTNGVLLEAARNAREGMEILRTATIRDQAGRVTGIHTDKSAQLNSIKEALLGSVRQALNWGTPQKAELERLERLLATDGVRAIINNDVQIPALAQLVRDAGYARLQALGLERAPRRSQQ
jgi:hypothetical protein